MLPGTVGRDKDHHMEKSRARPEPVKPYRPRRGRVNPSNSNMPVEREARENLPIGRPVGSLTKNKSSNPKAVFIFVLLAGSSFYIELAGQIYAAELILLLYIGHKLIQRNKNNSVIPTWMSIGLVLWILGSILSDIGQTTEGLQTSKGILRVLFLGSNLIGLTYLLGSSKSRIMLAWTAVAVSICLAFVLQPNIYARDLPWKFSFGLPISILVALWLSIRHEERKITVPVLMALAGVHFALGFRSMAVITAVVAIVLVVRRRKTEVSDGKRVVRLRPVVLALLASSLVILLTNVYDQLALDGQLGSAAQQKAAYQADGAFGSIFSSRNEFFLSAASIVDSPIIGGGSYSVASPEAAQSVADLYGLYGYQHVAGAVAMHAPAYHSELFGLWAENGALALPFWLGVLFLYLISITAVLYRRCQAPVLVAMTATIGIWDLFFSPFGADRRMWLALSLVTLIAFTKRERSTRAKNIDRNYKLQPSAISRPMH